MSTKYSEMAEILAVKPIDILEATAIVRINVKGIELECFVPHFKVTSHFSVGEKCEVIISLLLYLNTLILSERKKYIENITLTPIPRCVLSGEIIDIVPTSDPNTGKIVVDCGVIVDVNIAIKKYELHKGDYIKAEGRLDVYKC